ncbi:MAG: aminoacyl-tRNA hydrolase [Candidatus Moranbacteria bacterium]|nr:aminoacyl-tRNA hydrolase [Candidatus Moranbacteria bacterium]
MLLIIGLGNIGKKYERTRHNAGFLALDYIHHTHQCDAWTEEKNLSGFVSKGTLGTQKVLLFKPATLMNNSGLAVAKIIHYYKLTLNKIIVIHDDMDIPSGKVKLTLSSRAAGNNGVQSIIDHLRTQDFKRIRIGIGRPSDTLGYCEPSHNYVLENFTPPEEELLQALFEKTFSTPTFIE